MVLVEEPPEAEPGALRYRLLEPIRQLAEEQLLAAGEAAVVGARHRDWYLGLAEQALDGMEGPDQRRWWDRLDLEHDNLLAALAWSAADPAGAPALLRLAGRLGRYWQARGLAREGIRWPERALARSEATPSADRARALNWLGQLEIVGSGNVARVRPLLEQSIAAARAVGDRRLLSMALRHLGQGLLAFGRPAEARRRFEQALAVSRVAGPPREIAWNLSVLGVTLTAEGQREAPDALLRESIALGRRAGDDTPVIASLRALAELYRARGDVARGRSAAREALAIARRLGVGLWSLSLLVTLGTSPRPNRTGRRPRTCTGKASSSRAAAGCPGRWPTLSGATPRAASRAATTAARRGSTAPRPRSPRRPGP
jgi:tetratricopeptide (TPR) repeat protein